MVGQFKDDRVQAHGHEVNGWYGSSTAKISIVGGSGDNIGSYTTSNTNIKNCRNGNTTRGKSKGVKYIIKVL